MERRDPRGLRDAEGERCPTPDEIEIQRLVAWYFQSSPGSAFDRRRETGDRPEGTGIGH